ncbi:hypothetical protein HPB51_011991 [Rhipicephalus microplus]|uniref:Uncharacterized protein n=1 Tax=Rhipicephalus microplus TaxID=6941 RepID=A0A9J6F2H9_RHIMP|nr:hypothetical protein HPB51_011991 [Rhipicephalus microplus]
MESRLALDMQTILRLLSPESTERRSCEAAVGSSPAARPVDLPLRAATTQGGAAPLSVPTQSSESSRQVPLGIHSCRVSRVDEAAQASSHADAGGRRRLPRIQSGVLLFDVVGREGQGDQSDFGRVTDGSGSGGCFACRGVSVNGAVRCFLAPHPLQAAFASSSFSASPASDVRPKRRRIIPDDREHRMDTVYGRSQSVDVKLGVFPFGHPGFDVERPQHFDLFARGKVQAELDLSFIGENGVVLLKVHGDAEVYATRYLPLPT